MHAATAKPSPPALDALAVDAAAVQVVRGRAPLDLAIGETLARLCEGSRLLELGYARQVDYARERLGISARSLQSSLRLARGLAGRPLLRRAVAAGMVTQRKALTVMAVAVGADEAAWTAAAINATDCWLQEAVRAEGHAPPPEAAFETESLRLRMSPAHQDRLDAAIAAARESGLGYAAPRWRCLEAICQECLGAIGGEMGEGPGEGDGAAGPASSPPPPAPPVPPLPPVPEAAVARQLEAVEEALGIVREEDDPPPLDARALDARVRRLLRAKADYDRSFGPLAARIVEDRVPAELGYRSLEEYCRERLGVAARSVRERAWLERRMCALWRLRRAFDAGLLTYSKAKLVAKDATVFDVALRIEEAAATTWQQLRRESTRREDRRNRAAGVRRLWGPADAMETVRHAIASVRAHVRANGGPDVDDGEALALIAGHFLAVVERHRPKRPRLSRERRDVLMRHDGLCAAPGCSREAAHVHHIEFRSRGGSDAAWNKLGLCVAHHLFAVHRGFLRVSGRAGERLEWRFATGEVFVTEGDDDVRRRDGAPTSAA